MSVSIENDISFADATLKALKDNIPVSQRSEFVNRAIIKALNDLKKEKALLALESFRKQYPDGKPVVETLREIRQQEVDKLFES